MKVIETSYDGYMFRSRLEARWAVFFNALGIRWEYEKEGYDLDGVWYLPDFWLPDLNCWYEVKGECPTSEEYKKAKLLCHHSGKRVYIAEGEIKLPRYEEICPEAFDSNYIHTSLYEYRPPNDEVWAQAVYEPSRIYPDWPFAFWVECSLCGKIEIASGPMQGDLSCSVSCLQTYREETKAKMDSLDTLFDDYAPGGKYYDPDLPKKYLDDLIERRSHESVFDSNRLMAAYTAARRARFEHLEGGR